MRTRLVVQTTVWLAVMGAILFVAAGDGRWPQGWIFLADSGVCSFAVGFWLLHHDPALLASRLSSPVRQRDQMPWDRVFMRVVMIVFIGWIVLIGLDARRFAWSHVPVWVQVIGAILIPLGMFLVAQVFRFNTFAAPQVRIQTARAQHVITDGPYRIVRHPMYAASILYLLGVPLLLGSWWGVAVVPLMVAGLVPRVVGEERMLRRELAGYDAYAKRVRYRLLPGIW
jgi:protein-S-isoprenylcysteine O-methyltransferase Ste14